MLIGLLVPSLQAARESARRTKCAGQLNQIGLAIVLAHEAQRSYPTGRDTRDQFGQSWAFRLLPLMESQAVFDALHVDRATPKTVPMWDDRNAIAMRTPVSSFFCPTRRSPAADRNFDNHDQPPVKEGVAAGGDYAANAGTYFNYATGTTGLDPKRAGPIFTFSKIRAAQVTDGLTKTFAVGERHFPRVDTAVVAANMVQWARGDTAFFASDNPFTLFRDPSDGLAVGPGDPDRRKYGSGHFSVCQFVFLDGHVEPIAFDVDATVLQWYSAIGDGNDPTRAADAGDGES